MENNEKCEKCKGIAVDEIVHYRNLAIRLGAKPNDMLDEFDRKVCAMGIDDDDWAVFDQTSAWETVDSLREEIERLQKLLEKANESKSNT